MHEGYQTLNAEFQEAINFFKPILFDSLTKAEEKLKTFTEELDEEFLDRLEKKTPGSRQTLNTTLEVVSNFFKQTSADVKTLLKPQEVQEAKATLPR